MASIGCCQRLGNYSGPRALGLRKSSRHRLDLMPKSGSWKSPRVGGHRFHLSLLELVLQSPVGAHTCLSRPTSEEHRLSSVLKTFPPLKLNYSCKALETTSPIASFCWEAIKDNQGKSHTRPNQLTMRSHEYGKVCMIARQTSSEFIPWVFVVFLRSHSVAQNGP